jgi:drug/metabolite transporter (DMT)-like permease
MKPLHLKVGATSRSRKTGMISLCAVPIFWVIALIVGDFSTLASLPCEIWVMIVASGIICISIAHTLYYITIKRIGLVIPVLVLSVNPFIVLMLSYMIFGESINLYQFILVTGSVLATFAQHQVKMKHKDHDSCSEAVEKTE